MGVDPSPSQWGPKLWYVMHTFSFFYPVYPTINDLSNYKTFYENLAHTIPCRVCKDHYKLLLMEDPIDSHLNSRDDLMRWVWKIHNKVNERLGKDQIPFAELDKILHKDYASESVENNHRQYKFIMAGVLSVVALSIMHNKFFKTKK